MTNEELIKAFREYVGRFDNEIGPKDFGQFGTWQRQLVRKLKYDEFVEKYKQYRQMEEVYQGVLERGDTINDMMLLALREVATELLIKLSF